MQENNRKILIIDDEQTVLDVLEGSLTLLGYSVRTTSNEKDFRDALQQAKPDIILMDIHMPGTDGIRLSHEVRCAPETADIPIIIVTGYTDKETFHDAMLFGANDFISKPFEIPMVQQKIEEWITKYQAKRGGAKG